MLLPLWGLSLYIVILVHIAKLLFGIIVYQTTIKEL